MGQTRIISEVYVKHCNDKGIYSINLPVVHNLARVYLQTNKNKQLCIKHIETKKTKFVSADSLRVVSVC